MRGAPQVGFSATIRRINARISLLIGLHPTLDFALESHFQYSRKPARCQRTTVLGVTRIRGSFHRDHSLRKATQKSFCAESPARSLGLESKQLLAEGEILARIYLPNQTASPDCGIAVSPVPNVPWLHGMPAPTPNSPDRFIHKFSRVALHDREGLILIESTCTRCGSCVTVSICDGSLQEWESQHACSSSRGTPALFSR